MTATLLTPPDEIINFSGISWQTYETLLRELSHRRLRLTYNRGNLEIMAPSPEHELGKEILGRFVETLAEELEVQIYPLGSTTFKRPQLSGAEPDKCYYIRQISAVRGKKRIDLTEDPAPFGFAVAHGGNPHRPWRLPFSQRERLTPREKTALSHQI